MFTARIQAHQLPERLDAEYFTPEFVSADERIADASRRLGCLKSLDQLRDPLAGLCYGVLQPRFVEHGVPAIEIGDLAAGVLHPPELRISKEQHHEYRRSAVVGGDILISVKGTLGVTAIAPEGIGESNVNRDIARLRVRRSEVDSYYLVSFLRTSPGGLSLQRIVRGTIQRNLNIGDLLEHRVLVPHELAQRYIGDKVRQAERLRERARRLEAESSAFLQLSEWTAPRAGARRAYTARRLGMRSERLDAPFYDPAHEDLDGLLRRRGDIELGEVASLVEARWTRGGDKFSYFEIGELDIALGILSPTITDVAEAPSRAQILVEPWDVLVSTVRPNRKNVGLVLSSDDGLALVASTGFAVLRFQSAEAAAFYHSFLRSDAATQQLMRWNSGATYPAIESDVPLRVRVPRFDDKVVEREGGRWLTKFSALSASRRLTLVATTLIEHLIDGRLNEAELVAAQKALEAGDRSADREILKGLRQSDHPDAKAVIADVDTLYALLDESEGGDA